MFMQNIRRATRKHRKLLLVIVILLCVGMVGSFAVWGSGNFNTDKDWSEMTFVEKAQYYQNYIPTLGYPEEASELTYEQASELGDLYQTLSNLAQSAFDEESAEGYDAIATDSLSKAVGYLVQAAELSKDLPDSEMQRQWENIASIYTNLGETSSSEAAYHKAAGFAEAALDLTDLSEQEKADAYISVGDLYVSGADLDSASRLYWKAIDIYRASLDQAETAADKAGIWVNIAGLFEKSGDTEGRANAYQEAIR